jgi:hypothetical protein
MGKIGRIVKLTPTGLAETIIESANPHLKSHRFSIPVLVRMPHDDDNDETPLIANELLTQFEWSQQQVRVNNPEHVLAKHVLVYYDPRFAYNIVRAPEGMELYENPALPRRNALIASGDPAAGVWVLMAKAVTLVTGPDHNRERRARTRAAEAEMRTIHVPAMVRVTTNSATTTRAERLAPSASTGSTQWYSARTSEWPDADDATVVTDLDGYVQATRHQRAVTRPPHRRHDFSAMDDATTDADLVSDVQGVADWMTARNIPITGATLEQLFHFIIASSNH